MKKYIVLLLLIPALIYVAQSDEGISGSNAVINISIVIDTSLDVSSLTADTVTANIGIIGNYQDSLDAHTDTLQTLRTVSNQQQDSLAKHTDSLEALRTVSNQQQDSLAAHTDSTEAHRAALNQLQDSITTHTDSAEVFRAGLNAHTDSIAALRAELNKFQSDSAAFVTTSTRLAVYIPGVLPGDLFTATPRGLDAGDGSEALPVADDLIKCVAKADSGIFLRAAGTTSGLKFVWDLKIKQ